MGSVWPLSPASAGRGVFSYCSKGCILNPPVPVYSTSLSLLVPLCALPSGLEGGVELFGNVPGVLAASAKAAPEVSVRGGKKL